MEIVGFFKVRKGIIRRETGTGLVLWGALGVQARVHMVVEKHSFSPIDGRVENSIRLQVLTIQIYST